MLKLAALGVTSIMRVAKFTLVDVSSGQLKVIFALKLTAL
jgi:hypothetical protein